MRSKKSHSYARLLLLLLGFIHLNVLGGCDGKGPESLNEPQSSPLVGEIKKNTEDTGNQLDTTPLTIVPQIAGHGSVLMNGDEVSSILFTSQRALDGSDSLNQNETHNIWIFKTDGTGATPLTQLTADNADTYALQWSPDGTQIVFESQRSLDGSNAANTNQTENIWIMNADGSQARPLTRATAERAHAWSPHWSPDGSRIAFLSAMALDGSDALNGDEVYNIWVMNADGSGQIPLTQLTVAAVADYPHPHWSPDGTRIAFASSRALDPARDAVNLNGVSNIWVMNADGTDQNPLTSLTATDVMNYEPQWAPDGNRIVYISNRALDGSNNLIDAPASSDAWNTFRIRNIWIMNADGTNQQPLTRMTSYWTGDSVGSRWSPDGSRIGFVSRMSVDGSDRTSYPYNLWVINADGTGMTSITRITAASAHNSGFTWSSDQGQIFFHSERALGETDARNLNGTYNIWAIDQDGNNPRFLTDQTAGPIWNILQWW